MLKQKEKELECIALRDKIEDCEECAVYAYQLQQEQLMKEP